MKRRYMTGLNKTVSELGTRVVFKVEILNGPLALRLWFEIRMKYFLKYIKATLRIVKVSFKKR